MIVALRGSASSRLGRRSESGRRRRRWGGDPRATLRRDTWSARPATAARFLRSDGLGRPPGSNDEFAAFLVGGLILALYPRDLLRAVAAPDLAPPAPGTWNGVTLALNVDDRSEVDRVFDHAVQAGARPVASPQDRDWGGRSGYVADPEENRWEIAWAPGVAFNDAGAVIEP